MTHHNYGSIALPLLRLIIVFLVFCEDTYFICDKMIPMIPYLIFRTFQCIHPFSIPFLHTAADFIWGRVFLEASLWGVSGARGRQPIMAWCGWCLHWCQLLWTLHPQSGATSTTAACWKRVLRRLHRHSAWKRRDRHYSSNYYHLTSQSFYL